MNIINEFFVSFILIKLYFKFKVCRKIKFPLLWKFYFSKWKFYFSADTLVDEFIKIYIKPYEKAKELIIKYQDQRCIIISATAEFLVRKIASFLGVRESIAIKCERVGDKFSGKAYGIYSFKEGKVLRLKEYLGKDYEKWMKDSYFFSDSINDLPLLESVSKAFVCNGDEKILKIAKERKYEILTF